MAIRASISGASTPVYRKIGNTRVEYSSGAKTVALTQGVISDFIYEQAVARILAFFAANPDWGWDPDLVTASLDLQVEAVEVPGRTIPVDWGWLT